MSALFTDRETKTSPAPRLVPETTPSQRCGLLRALMEEGGGHLAQDLAPFRPLLIAAANRRLPVVTERWERPATREHGTRSRDLNERAIALAAPLQDPETRDPGRRAELLESLGRLDRLCAGVIDADLLHAAACETVQSRFDAAAPTRVR